MNTDRIGDITVAQLDANYTGFDDHLLDETQQHLFELVDRAEPPLVLLDLTHTEFFGSTFIEMLFRVWNRVNRRSGQFALCGLNPNCRDILHTARLDTLWTIYATVEEAVDKLKRRR